MPLNGKKRRRDSTPIVEETSSSENSSKPSSYNNAAPTVLAHAAKGPSDLEKHWLALHGDTEAVKRKEIAAKPVAAGTHLSQAPPLRTPSPVMPTTPTKCTPVLRYGSTSTHTSDGVLSYLSGGGFGQGCPVDRKGRYKYNKRYKYNEPFTFASPTKIAGDNSESDGNLEGVQREENKEVRH
ncbi:hypothetical protein SERLADRAFT_387671 [Serpula lacrymans var. lacrymans S7.9]|uniref:Uncharacterized protein n=1 Tax=Serpula lacrymans var. lacrymans (strain S7.9) TaxID=578457 RepID=F8NT74_SERL9|nr:uncharacterized protein SERLADRAFT_387671 [Serpula lacrymans var. lacrymans S7.9]EGO25547.1 hypothetical protein SERLADRAFT_387671 [Serpula lacrymans var. lacrymans S7.9]